jgi:transcriptional regulator with XRE-family HTH domain
MDEEIRPYLALVEQLLEEEGLSKQDLAERLVWSKANLYKVLGGKRDLKVRQLHAILGAIGVSPRDYYQRLFGIAGDDAAASSATNGKSLALTEALTEGELERTIEEAVRRALAPYAKLLS